jgi:hypothetical protein
LSSASGSGCPNSIVSRIHRALVLDLPADEAADHPRLFVADVFAVPLRSVDTEFDQLAH